ncbi:TauD/TfdA dioxygenase family protein [Sulfitobacter aestuariivivens]|uniref:TauD/TfdA family dioxygenase n=1 Tax=Sulfitobacter aestuariivivens TaxID=2766981 RepID=A0A927D0U4_9RHOB|nr:TauD/TfdA family dioxygenase [Sulfitobacter aestuariivivens]MBD3663000.1 TauD/TfdA family dioxygenase [Sulfitobacter aestuariivivens]
MGWEITRISGHLGATLRGVLLKNADSAALKAVEDALYAYGVVVLPDQHLAPEDHIRVARQFGDIDVNRFFTPVASHPMIAEVRTQPEQTAVIGGTWHTDHSYDAAPAMCSILSARELPTVGGDTHFASMTAAYQALSSGLQAMLCGLKAEHSDSSFADPAGLGLGTDPDAFRPPVLHPVVIRHPVTGAPCVYVNGDFTTRFDGWTVVESAPLLRYLYRFVTQPIFTARVVWKEGMVAIWDNRLVQHYATADYPGESRLMHRITVKGVPLEPYSQPSSN